MPGSEGLCSRGCGGPHSSTLPTAEPGYSVLPNTGEFQDCEGCPFNQARCTHEAVPGLPRPARTLPDPGPGCEAPRAFPPTAPHPRQRRPAASAFPRVPRRLRVPAYHALAAEPLGDFRAEPPHCGQIEAPTTRLEMEHTSGGHGGGDGAGMPDGCTHTTGASSGAQVLRDPKLRVAGRPAAGAGDTPPCRTWVLMPLRSPARPGEAMPRRAGSRPPAPRPHPLRGLLPGAHGDLARLRRPGSFSSARACP